MENSFQLIKKLKGKYFESDYILVSLDVISLFINVPIDLIYPEKYNQKMELYSE